MTTTEITTHALALGITRELYPCLWRQRIHFCSECGLDHFDNSCPRCGCSLHNGPLYACTLPDPLSDDPRACLWEPFYMRALGWPTIKPDINRGFVMQRPWSSIHEATPTAALHAAWLAKGASK